MQGIDIQILLKIILFIIIFILCEVILQLIHSSKKFLNSIQGNYRRLLRYLMIVSSALSINAIVFLVFAESFGVSTLQQLANQLYDIIKDIIQLLFFIIVFSVILPVIGVMYLTYSKKIKNILIEKWEESEENVENSIEYLKDTLIFCATMTFFFMVIVYYNLE